MYEYIINCFGASEKVPVIREICWLPPTGNPLELNVDGISVGNPGRSGFGGLIKNIYAEWVVGFAGFCSIIININAQILAIYHGIMLARNNGYQDVICESDCKSALSLITNGYSHVHPHAPLVNKIRKFQSYSWRLQFTHTLREGNFCTDWLAKYGASLDAALCTWNACPISWTLFC